MKNVINIKMTSSWFYKNQINYEKECVIVNKIFDKLNLGEVRLLQYIINYIRVESSSNDTSFRG